MSPTLAIFVVIFAIALAGVNSRPQSGSFDCTGKPDGFYADLLDSNGYNVCLEEHLMVHIKCGEREHFDDTLKRCVKETGEDGSEQLVKSANTDDGDLEALKSEISELLKDENETPVWPEDGPQGISKYKVYNVQITENIFPESFLVIGKANREQKNK